MKILLVGASEQGKRVYAAKRYGVMQQKEDVVFIPQLHMMVHSLLEKGMDAQMDILSNLEGKQDWIIICDEIGCGIVPTNAFSREWREQTGRLCCKLAEDADIVERIICGIPQRLKG